MIGPDAKGFHSLVVVPDERLNLEDCIQFFDNQRTAMCESIEASNEALVYSLYQEICDTIPHEDREFDDWSVPRLRFHARSFGSYLDLRKSLTSDMKAIPRPRD